MTALIDRIVVESQALGFEFRPGPQDEEEPRESSNIDDFARVPGLLRMPA